MSYLSRKLGIRLCESGRMCFSSRIRRFDVSNEIGKDVQPFREESEDQWKSVFSDSAPGARPNVAVLRFLHSPIDLSPTSILAWLQRRIYQREIKAQSLKKARHELLGSDLAVAHFLLKRKCAVQFKDGPWLKHEDLHTMKLPDMYKEGWFLEAIDVSGCPLYYEGFQNLRNLKHLRSLIAQNSPHLDDWCLDHLSSDLPNVQTLDLSGCSNITERGLATLTRFRNLKYLILSDIPRSSKAVFRLTCVMLQEEFPDLAIIGVDLNQEPVTEEITEPS